MAITRIRRDVVGMIGMFNIPTVTIRLMALATVSLSLMLAVEDASRVAPPATPEHDVVENYHGRQVHNPYRWLEEAGAPAVEQWIDAQNAYTDDVMSGFRGLWSLTDRFPAVGFDQVSDTRQNFVQ
ncbi:MAG TPA: hypothetical protein VEJ45_02025 [Candidatus Acidoferrales bacterium]|nr:hypothetical protein [Candidatus Acidoferrales bacterium]